MTESELLSANFRARNLVIRVQDRNLAARMPELLGIPMAAGTPPFVVRKSHLVGQSKGIENLRVQFDLGDGTLTRLVLVGTFGEGGKHRASLQNLRDSLPFSYYSGNLAVKMQQRDWAEKQRDKPRPATSPRVKLSDQDQVSRHRSKIETKINQITLGIAKVRKRAEKIEPTRPANPLLNDRAGYTCDYIRDEAAAWYAAKPQRKLLSQLAAQRKDCKSWPEWYARAKDAGVRISYEYAKVRGWKHGPKTPEDYLHSLKWIGVYPQARNYYLNPGENQLERMLRYQVARGEYLAQLKTWKAELSEIESLEAVREGYELELAEMAKEGE